MAYPTKILLFVLPCFAACAAAPSPSPQFYSQYRTKLSIDYAQRSADSAFEPVDDQDTLGIEYDVRQPNASSSFELGLFYSEEKKSKDVPGTGNVDYEGTLFELSMGGRLYLDSEFLKGRPYAAAGLSGFIGRYRADADSGSEVGETDWALGPYYRIGMEWMIGDHISVALDYRQVLFSNVVHDLDIGNGEHADANYQQAGLVLGWTF
jgi:opacity protein-like surface antigen